MVSGSSLLCCAQLVYFMSDKYLKQLLCVSVTVLFSVCVLKTTVCTLTVKWLCKVLCFIVGVSVSSRPLKIIYNK